MPNTWAIADTHFNHANIIKYCDRPENHDQLMLDNWKSIVGPLDTVYHLGDFALTSKERIVDLARGLPGKKILIKGNHDRHNSKCYLDAGFEAVYQNPIILTTDAGILVLSHRPIPKADVVALLPWRNRPWINVHGHIHNSVSDWATPPEYVNASVEMHDYKPILLPIFDKEEPVRLVKPSKAVITESVYLTYQNTGDESAGFKAGKLYKLDIKYNKAGDFIHVECPDKGFKKSYTSLLTFVKDWRV